MLGLTLCQSNIRSTFHLPLAVSTAPVGLRVRQLRSQDLVDLAHQINIFHLGSGEFLEDFGSGQLVLKLGDPALILDLDRRIFRLQLGDPVQLRPPAPCSPAGGRFLLADIAERP